MNEIKHISSIQNPWVKKITALKQKSRERKKSKSFVVEGCRELQMALIGNYSIETVFYCKEITTLRKITGLHKATEDVGEYIEISKNVYQKIAHRNSTEGVIALARCKDHALHNLSLQNDTPLILVAEAPEKPGNIGALLRTADAANLDAVIIADRKGDLYNPNIIRSSIGCVFTVKVILASSSDTIKWLRDKNIHIFAASLKQAKNYTAVNYSISCAIAMGTEATGLSPDWIKEADSRIKIPMNGEIDSLNVSVSAAILIFEAKRQRGFQ